MFVIYNKDRHITIEWKILDGVNMISPNFRKANMKVFLLGGDEVYNVDYTLRDDGNGIWSIIVQCESKDLCSGVYDLKAVWYINRHNILPKVEYNRFLLWSIRKNVFAITDNMAEVNNDQASYLVSVKSYVEPIGADGLSAYEIALFRGLTSIKSEKEWAEQEVIRQENELARAAREEDRAKAELTRESNEKKRVNSELDRQAQETDRVSSEEERVSNEETRITNEQIRERKESIREAAETSRVQQEALRIQQEEERFYSEQDRFKQEAQRLNNEKERKQSETEREAAELSRAGNEQSRVDAEVVRENNERNRVQSEIDRDKRVDDALAEIRASRPITSDEVKHFEVLTEAGYNLLVDAGGVDDEVVYLIV